MKPKIQPNSKGKIRNPSTIDLDESIKCEDKPFVDLIKACLVFDPKKRFTPNEALAHEWILDGLPPNLKAQHMKLIETPNEYKSSVKIKEEILDPFHAKQNQNSREDLKADSDHNSAWKSPQSKASCISQADNFSEQANLFEKNSKKSLKSLEDLGTKKLNLDLKTQGDEDSVINITINLSDSKRNLLLHQPMKKGHHKSESIAIFGAGSHRKDENTKINLVNNYFYINTNSQRSTSRNPPGSLDSEDRRDNKYHKGAIHISERTLDLEYPGENFETNNDNTNNIVILDTPTHKQYESIRVNHSLSSFNNINLSNYQNSRVKEGSSSGLLAQSPKKYNSSTNLNFMSNMPIAESMVVNNTSVEYPTTTNNNYSSNIYIKSNTQTDASSPAHKNSSTIHTQPNMNTSITIGTYQLPNSTLNPTSRAAQAQNQTQNTASSIGNTSIGNAQPNSAGLPGSTSNIGIYRYINNNTSHQKSTKSMYRSDSLYAQSTSNQADHYYSMGSSSTREKASFINKQQPSNTASSSHFNNLYNSASGKDFSNLGLKSPQSTRMPDKSSTITAAKKSSVLDTKSNIFYIKKKTNFFLEGTHTLHSPKTSEAMLSKLTAEAKQEGFSVSPRHMVFSMLKYPLTKKK